jgi:hypothetical protein
VNEKRRASRWKKSNESLLLHVCGGFSEIPLCHKAPMERTNKQTLRQTGSATKLNLKVDSPNYPRLKALHITLDHGLDLGSPVRGDGRAVSLEGVDRQAAQFPNVVDRTLQRVTVVFRKNGDHVVRVATGLLDIVRKYVLYGFVSERIKGRLQSTNVGPGNEVVGGLVEGHDHRIVEDEIRQVDVKSVPGV